MHQIALLSIYLPKSIRWLCQAFSRVIRIDFSNCLFMFLMFLDRTSRSGLLFHRWHAHQLWHIIHLMVSESIIYLNRSLLCMIMWFIHFDFKNICTIKCNNLNIVPNISSKVWDDLSDWINLNSSVFCQIYLEDVFDLKDRLEKTRKTALCVTNLQTLRFYVTRKWLWHSSLVY